MSHENARILTTMVGAIVPLMLFAAIPFALNGTRDGAALVGLLIISAAALIFLGQIAFTAMAVFWRCSHCEKRYFQHFMPYWPLSRSCANCCQAD